MDSQQSVVVVSAPSSARALIHPLRAAGYRVRVVPSIDAWDDEVALPRPQCVVIDVSANARAALTADDWRRLRERGAAPVIVYGGSDLRFVVRAMREGAVDLLPAPLDSDALVIAVAQGVARAATTHVSAQHGARAQALLARCTPREHSIVVRVSRGQRNKAIAHDLACKESTVKVHRSRAMRKLGLRSLAELIHLVELAGDASPRASHDTFPGRIRRVHAHPWTHSAIAGSPGD